ncbi:MAG: PAS domain S-box protein, partial [Desulfobacterales bacterium]|nr:PAS domain S-box protein [Desulfobacterales bacterium]
MQQVKALNVAIVGGGPGCRAIMDMIFSGKLSQLRMKLIGVADTDPDAVGYRYAREKGIYTTKNYRDLYSLEELNLVIELTGSDVVANKIFLTKPANVRLVDHVVARLFWDLFEIEEQRITDRKLAEGRLQESEEKYRVLFETAKDAVFVSDETGGFLDVNQAACKSLGYSKAELLKSSNKEIDADPRGYEAFLKIRDGLVDKITFEVNQRRKDGTLLPVEITGSFFDSGGRRMALAIARDVTDRKQAEDKLKEAQRYTRGLIEANLDALVT